MQPSNFDRQVTSTDRAGLHAAERIRVVQVNIGLRCNLICRHCHVNSSPRRKEAMDWATMQRVVSFAREIGCETVDITGGAPEMHPEFRRFVDALRDAGLSVKVRTNLTILLEPGFEDLPEFFARHRIELVASLPCYLEENVDRQRGDGVYAGSIEAIWRLNAFGYGRDSDLVLNLVYNPGGDSLPPSQDTLEGDYRRELRDRFGIEFTHLHTITNAPIGRFRGDLRRQGRLETYLEALRAAFNPDTVERLMCRDQISVRWDGRLFDCDFNLALGLGVDSTVPTHIDAVRPADLVNRRIATGDHCFACTAGAGSSCGGALVG